MSIMFFGDLDVVMAEKFGDDVDVDTAHDEVAGECRAEHFDVGIDAGFLGVS